MPNFLIKAASTTNKSINYISYIWTSTIINSFISNIYSGPTNHKQHYSHQDFPLSRSHSQSSYYFFNFYNNIHCIFIYTFVFHVFIRVSILERGLSKIENKYTLKMKCFGNNGMGDDGYKWRKYGQKSIKNSPNPR